ncbi:MAG: hypothetical protein M3O46_03510 [Myxococcota bacterium]|nr:hypothetical protein [Myxococcota bacterium]
MTKRTTRARTWTAAFVALGITVTTSLFAEIARAEDKEGDAPPNRARQAESPPQAPIQVELVKPVAPEGQNARRFITDWEEGEPIPPGYHPVQRMRRGPIIAGAVTFGVLYFLNVLVAAGGTDAANVNHSSSSLNGLYVPVIGPFITMTQTSSAIANVFLVLDGAGQAAGAVLLLYGLTSPQTVLRRDNYGRPTLLPQPMFFGRNGGGVGLTGTF